MAFNPDGSLVGWSSQWGPELTVADQARQARLARRAPNPMGQNPATPWVRPHAGLPEGYVPMTADGRMADWYGVSGPRNSASGQGAAGANVQPGGWSGPAPVSVGGLSNGGVSPAMLAQILRGGGFSPGGSGPGPMMPSYDPGAFAGMSAGESGMAPGGQFAGLNRQMYRPAPSMPGMPNANADGQFLGPDGQPQQSQWSGFGARRAF